MKAAALSAHRLEPQFTAVSFNNFFDNSQPNSAARILLFGVQSLKNNKNAFKVMEVNPNAIVSNADLPHLAVRLGRNVNLWRDPFTPKL